MLLHCYYYLGGYFEKTDRNPVLLLINGVYSCLSCLCKMTTFKKTLIKHEPNVITRQFDDAPYWKHLEVSFSSFNHIFDVMSDNQVERIMHFFSTNQVLRIFSFLSQEKILEPCPTLKYRILCRDMRLLVQLRYLCFPGKHFLVMVKIRRIYSM